MSVPLLCQQSLLLPDMYNVTCALFGPKHTVKIKTTDDKISSKCWLDRVMRKYDSFHCSNEVDSFNLIT